MRRSDRLPAAILAGFSLVLAAFLAIPLAALALYFLRHQDWHSLATPDAVRALVLTLETTAAATALCVIFGLPIAYVLARVPFPGRRLLETLVDLPIVLPPVVAGVALLLAFGRRGLIGRHLDAVGIQLGFSTVAVIMAQVFIASPFFIRAARAGFAGVDRELEQAALSLGATRWQAFWQVSVPLAGSSLAAGMVLAWARALSEFGATMMFAGNFPGRTQTLTLAVMTAMESNIDTAVAISMLSLALALTTLIAARLLFHEP